MNGGRGGGGGGMRGMAGMGFLGDQPQPDNPVAAEPGQIIHPNDNGIYYFNTTYAANGEYSVLYIDVNNVAHYGRHPVKTLDNVRSVYVCYGTNRVGSHTFFFLKTNNELWAMGENKHGTVGDDTGLNRSEPVFIMRDVANLYFERGGDGDTVYALKTDKSRWMWGYRRGDKNIFAPVRINNYFNHNQQLLEDHISMKNGNAEIYESVQIPRDIEAMLGGKDNITTSLETRKILGGHAQGGIPRTYAITKDSVLWGWGRNEGYLGDGTRADRNRPVKIAEKIKRLLPEYFITQSNDWYSYSDVVLGRGEFKPKLRRKNVLYVDSIQTYFTLNGELVKSGSVSIENIKLPSIVRASDGQVIAPTPEQIERIAPRARP